jgi:hypothetical protein
MRAARAVARELMRDGALAVVLTGSHVRGGALAESDIDLIAVLRRAPKSGHVDIPIQRRAAFLVNSSWTTRSAVRDELRDPAHAGAVVPGWREALILNDPGGAAARIQRQAIAWRWEYIAAECDAWVASSITGWAEEVHKLSNALKHGTPMNTGVQRMLLAAKLAGIIAVHRRMLYGSENVLWDIVARAMGADWTAAQRAALALDGESLKQSARAALRLYAITAAEVAHLLDATQRRVVAHACELAGRPLPARGARERRR